MGRKFTELSAEDQAAATNDVLECARYDELEDLHLLWEMVPDLSADLVDGDQNSALHMAAANGHVRIIEFLVKEKKAKFSRNRAGNTPLHWALENKQEGAVLALIRDVPEIDVLEQNDNKKSSVTLAIDSENATIVEAVLNHPSAKKLEQQSKKNGTTEDGQEEEGEGQDGASEDQGVQLQTSQSVCEFGGNSLEIREVGLLDTSRNTDDLKTTGAFLWAASLALGKWIIDEKDFFAGKVVCELGAGCGLPGVVAYRCTDAQRVVISDLDSPTFPNTEHNVGLHEGRREGAELTAHALDWKDEATWPEDLLSQTDILIGSDLIYDLELVTPLVSVVRSLLRDGGDFFYVSADDDRAGLKEFVTAMKKVGFTTDSRPAPSAYLEDPFTEAAASFPLRFPEIAETKFTLYRFSMPPAPSSSAAANE